MKIFGKIFLGLVLVKYEEWKLYCVFRKGFEVEVVVYGKERWVGRDVFKSISRDRGRIR